MKKRILVLGALLMSCMIFVGCDKAPTPDESAKMLYEFYVQEDMSNIALLGITEEEANKIIEGGIENFKEDIRGSFKEYELEADEAKLSQLIDARTELEKQLEVTTEIVSQEGKKAEIKLSTTYFDEEAISNKASLDAVASMETSEITDEKEFLEASLTAYLDNVILGFQEAEIQPEKVSMTATFVKEGIYWLPEEEQQFVDDMVDLTAGYKK